MLRGVRSARVAVRGVRLSRPAPHVAARRGLAVLTTLLLAATVVAGYGRAELADREAFSARAASAFDDEAVRTAVATRIVDRIGTSVSPEVLAVRPLLIFALERLAATPIFRRAVEVAAADAHGQLLTGSSRYVVSLSPSTPVVGDALSSVAPPVARAIPADLRLDVVAIAPGDAVLAGARATADIAGLWWPLLIVSVLAAAALAVLAGTARDAIALLGATTMAAGLLVAAAITLLGIVVSSSDDPVRREARAALWSAFTGDVRASALLLMLGGIAAVAVAASAGAPDPLARVTQAAEPLLRSRRPAARAARAGLIGALGVLLLTAPGLGARIAAVGAGVVLVLLAAKQVWPGAETGRPEARRLRSGRLLALSAAGPVAAALVALVLVLPAPASPPAVGGGARGACNGSEALCARRLNDVVFPSTHNAYSAAEQPGWLLANQQSGIRKQLQDGIRGLLIDVHYGVEDPETGRVRTDIAAEGTTRSKVAQELSPAALRTADRLGTRVGGPLEGERRPYLCHTLCELGAEPLGQELEVLREFLAAAPREVVVLVVEPYVRVGEIEKALDEAGLLGQAARLQREAPLPTLGELIASGRRLVVLSEQDGGARPWYLPAFTFLQDTPLGARRGEDLRCERFRGDANSPMLLVNHWIDTVPPSPTRNQRIGGQFLRERVDRCARERGFVPNLIAVDFYERSGVTALAEALNR